MVDKWEYRFGPSGRGISLHKDDAREYLNQAGQEGWELCAAYPRMVFKRKIQEDQRDRDQLPEKGIIRSGLRDYASMGYLKENGEIHNE